MPNTGGVTLVNLGDEVLGDKEYQKALDKSLGAETVDADLQKYIDGIQVISAGQAAEILANGREL